MPLIYLLSLLSVHNIVVTKAFNVHCLNFSDGVNVPLIAAMAAMTALTVFGFAFKALKKRSRDSGYVLLKE